jgi:hypothetical protein
MTDPEQEIHEAERQFAGASGPILREARQVALKAGLSVLQSENGIIYRVFPDGRKEVTKHIDGPVQVIKGLILNIP